MMDSCTIVRAEGVAGMAKSAQFKNDVQHLLALCAVADLSVSNNRDG